MSTFFQCEECLRYFAPAGAGFGLLQPQPVVLSLVNGPELCVCGLEDCPAVAAALREAERRVVLRANAVAEAERARVAAKAKKRREERLRRRCAKAKRPGFAGRGSDDRCDRGMPPERDWVDPVHGGVEAVRPVASLAHGEQVKAFRESGNAAAQNETMLGLLRASFDVEHAERPGQWVSNAVLEDAGIGRPNSRASNLREHAWVVARGLDVDCTRIENRVNDKEHYAYRLCRRVDSVRLASRANRDARQEELLQ